MYLRQRCSQYSRRFDRPRPSRRLLAASLATTVLVLGLVAAAPGFGSSAAAASSPSCADAVTSAPTAPATVSAASSPFGRVLVVAAGDRRRKPVRSGDEPSRHVGPGRPQPGTRRTGPGSTAARNGRRQNGAGCSDGQ